MLIRARKIERKFDEDIWLVSFSHYDLGFFYLEQRTLQPLDNPFGPRLSPMSQDVLLPMSPGWTNAAVVPQEGFEPPTPSLRMMCSTN